MAKLNVQQIHEQEVALIEKHPKGIRFSEIWRWFRENHAEIPEGTLAAQLSEVVKKFPERVYKMSRGVYAPVIAASPVLASTIATKPPPEASGERAVYAPFARFLENELEEVTNAEPLGGASMKMKWGTPDVIGVYRSNSADPIKFPLEIVCAEIKTATDQAIVAFGQAISYRLFSHKVYIVVPGTMDKSEIDRLQALCLLFGVGLVTYMETGDQPRTFEFDIRSRALRFEPDTYYMNVFAKQLNGSAEQLFRKLFP